MQDIVTGATNMNEDLTLICMQTVVDGETGVEKITGLICGDKNGKILNFKRVD